MRRSPDNWKEGHPRLRGNRRVGEVERKTAVLRFPIPKAGQGRPDAFTQRLSSVQAAWSDREREQRRLDAIRKQQELLMLLADADLEEGMRMAVAAGEQPVVPPELEILRN